MSKTLPRPLLSLIVLCPTLLFAADAPPPALMHERHKALLETYCTDCHGAEKQKGKFRVDTLPFSLTEVRSAEKWQKILNALNSGDMPPDDAKQLPKDSKADFLDELSTVMVAARRNLGDQRGAITMRRLNRREYRNTLRELLGVEINVSELPPDTSSGGFDTVGANLFMSGNQFEQYQSLGREALTESFERQTAAAVEKKQRYEAEAWTPMVTKYVAYQIDARERAQRWVEAVNEAAAKPENSEIVAALKKTSKNDAIFRRLWEKIPGAPSPRSFGFDKKGENDADLANAELSASWLPYHQYYLRQPALDTGAYLGTQTQHPSVININYIEMLVPFSWPVGEYVVRVRIAATNDAPPDRRFLDFGINARSKVMNTCEVTGTMDAPQIIEFQLSMTRGNSVRENRTLFIREKGSWDDNYEGGRKRAAALKRNGIGPEFALWVDWMEIERKPDADKPKPPGIAALGIPLDDAAPPPDAAGLRTALERFATEAFRGSTPPARLIDRLTALYETRRKAGDKHSAALKETVSVVLASPMFLYLAEQSAPAADNESGASTARESRLLSAPELAARLSYFLWSAPPDSILRELARSGELMKPGMLEAQVERLLDDPRAEGFIKAFVQQWLGMERFDFFEVNLALYPRFDFATKNSARGEVYETVKHLIRQNASLRDLLKSDYVMADRVLAHFYGLPAGNGHGYEKIALPKDSPRGGLLGMAAVQFMGGNGERTSPVERGAWVLRKLLHDPPPPAPANIPAITRLAGKVLTTQERLRAHQEEPQCASCHRKIDPIGFGLENFDGAGQWRTEDSYQAIDANGKPDPKTKKTWTIEAAATLHKGPSFQTYFELRDIIASKTDAFSRGFSEALLEYALGRQVGFKDEPLLNQMLDKARTKDFAVREFIHTLVGSREFHTK